MKCPECGDIEKIENPTIGEICCVGCGLVLSWNPIEEFSIIKKIPLEDKRNMNAFRKVNYTDDGLGSSIMPNDRKSRRLAITHHRHSSKYYGGLSTQDKHFIVVCKHIIYQYGLPDTKGEILASCKLTKKRLGEKGFLRGYNTDFRAAVITFLHLKKHTSVRRHALVTGESQKRISRVSKKFARHMHTRQLLEIRSPTDMVIQTLGRMQYNGIEVPNEIRVKSCVLGEYIAKCLDETDRPYKNSTNATVIWLTGLMEGNTFRQQDITDVSEVTVQTIRTVLRLIIYPTFKIDKKTISNLTVDEFVNGIRKVNKNE
jgi:transcription initiation factor TFIIIB Brf1 subunit/transcription initiation factor TFIIB